MCCDNYIGGFSVFIVPYVERPSAACYCEVSGLSVAYSCRNWAEELYNEHISMFTLCIYPNLFYISIQFAEFFLVDLNGELGGVANKSRHFKRAKSKAISGLSQRL